MERDEFYGTVERRAELADRADAEDATQAVLSVVGESVDETISQRLSADAPSDVGDHLTDGPSGRRFSYDEFLDRVDERADRVGGMDAELLSQVVVETLLEHVEADEREAVVGELEDAGYESLFTNGGEH